jgi:amino acid transporter
MSTQLKAGSLSFIESLVMGVAGSAPGYSIAVSTVALLAAAGTLAPGALIIFAVPMLGIAVAYKALNRHTAHAGAAYQWTSATFGPLLGYFSGWALLVASMVFMITGSLPIATSTLDFINPALAGNVVLTTAVATVWFLLVAVVLIKGIEITSKVQLILSSIELAILGLVLVAAFVHAGAVPLATPFSWSWFGLHYTPAALSGAALVSIFFYWGWDVTANLSEETRDAEQTAGNGGFSSVFVTIGFYVAFTLAALFLFSLRDARSVSDNIIYAIALRAGLGRAGALFASIAVILSSIGTLETTMLQFSRTLFAMGRDGAMPPVFGVCSPRTQTPVRAMYLLIGIGLAVLWAASLMPSVNDIIQDSVNAIGVQVAYYYGLAGLAAAWTFRSLYKESVLRWLGVAVFPFLSAVFLIGMGLYAITTFNPLTKAVGVGGLAIGIVFFRPRRRATPASAVPAAE